MALLLAEELLPSAPENHSYHIIFIIITTSGWAEGFLIWSEELIVDDILSELPVQSDLFCHWSCSESTKRVMWTAAVHGEYYKACF